MRWLIQKEFVKYRKFPKLKKKFSNSTECREYFLIISNLSKKNSRGQNFLKFLPFSLTKLKLGTLRKKLWLRLEREEFVSGKSKKDVLDIAAAATLLYGARIKDSMKFHYYLKL